MSLKFQIFFYNQVLEQKVNSIMCLHLEKTCLPCIFCKISSHIWLFQNWIYTLHNNVHMLNSPYIYVMGWHFDQSCIPHYIPYKTMCMLSSPYFVMSSHHIGQISHFKKSIGSSVKGWNWNLRLLLSLRK